MKKILIMFSAVAMLTACADDPIGQTEQDGPAPTPLKVDDVTIIPQPGGADLVYKLPADEDLLYVEASYMTNRGPEKTRASVYQDTLKIRGFGDMEEHDVTLTTVNRKVKVSSPITVTIQPQEAPLYTIAKTFQMEAAFGGVKLTWLNVNQDNVVITLWKRDKEPNLDDPSTIDANGNPIFYEVETLYTSRKEGENSFRGMTDTEADFAVTISDKWQNKTEIVDEGENKNIWTLTPLFEMEIPYTFMRAYQASGDSNFAYGWRWERICDGNTGSGWHTNFGGDDLGGPWPHRLTVSYNRPIKMSRIKIYHRAPNDTQWFYKHGNPRQIYLYGYRGATLPESSNTVGVGGVTQYCEALEADGWELIRVCDSYKPSGSAELGAQSSEDTEYMTKGEEFDIDPMLPEYQHVKIVVTRNWAGSDSFAHLMEYVVYGSVEGVRDPSELQ